MTAVLLLQPDRLSEQLHRMPPLLLYFLFSLLLFHPVQSSPPRPDSDGAPPATDEDRALVVKCRQDSVEVELRAHLLDSDLSGRLLGLQLGPDGAGGGHCSAGSSADGPLSIRAPLSSCGSRVLVGERLLTGGRSAPGGVTPPPPRCCFSSQRWRCCTSTSCFCPSRRRSARIWWRPLLFLSSADTRGAPRPTAVTLKAH